MQHTLPSIQANLLAPLMGMAHGATLDSFAHLIDTHDLVDPAQPENKMPYLPPAEAELLRQLGTPSPNPNPSPSPNPNPNPKP